MLASVRRWPEDTDLSLTQRATPIGESLCSAVGCNACELYLNHSYIHRYRCVILGPPHIACYCEPAFV